MEELILLFKNYDHLYYEWAKKSGLAETAFYIMLEVWYQCGDCTQADIAAQLSMSKQTVNSALKGLEKEGFVELISVSPGNKKTVRMTQKGKKFAGKYVAPIMNLDETIWLALPREKREVCVNLIGEHIRLFGEALHKL